MNYNHFLVEETGEVLKCYFTSNKITTLHPVQLVPSHAVFLQDCYHYFDYHVDLSGHLDGDFMLIEILPNTQRELERLQMKLALLEWCNPFVLNHLVVIYDDKIKQLEIKMQGIKTYTIQSFESMLKEFFTSFSNDDFEDEEEQV